MNIRVENYFPIQLVALGVLLTLGGVLYIPQHVIGGIGLILIGVPLFSTHYRLEVSIAQKFWHDYIWLMGFRLGKKREYQTIHYWFINSSKYSAEYGSLVARGHVQGLLFSGYLKIDEEKVYFGQSTNKKYINRKVERANKSLSLPIKDLTIENS